MSVKLNAAVRQLNVATSILPALILLSSFLGFHQTVVAETIAATVHQVGTVTVPAIKKFGGGWGANDIRYNSPTKACDAHRAVYNYGSCGDPLVVPEPLISGVPAVWCHHVSPATGLCIPWVWEYIFYLCPEGSFSVFGFVTETDHTACTNNDLYYSCPPDGDWALSGTTCIRENPCPAHSSGPEASPTCTCDSGYASNPEHTACLDGFDDPLPNQPPAVDPDKSNNYGCGNPINPSSGLKFQVEIDYRSPSGLEFKRTYNSLTTDKANLPGTFGTGGWRLGWQPVVQGTSNAIISQLRPLAAAGGISAPYGVTVYRGAQATAIVTAPTIATANAIRSGGNVNTYNKQASGVWTTDPDINDQLSAQLGSGGTISGWAYTTADKAVEQYNPIGQLLSVTDRAGQTTTLIYSDGTATGSNGEVIVGTATPLPAGLLIRITDAYQYSINLAYDAASRIITMTDPAGESYGYAYDTSNNLISVTYPDGNSKQYLYEDTNFIHALTGIIDENGARYATYAYDSNGRAISTEHAGGAQRADITYNVGSSTITDALGSVRTQNYQVVQGVQKITAQSQPGGSGCAAASNALTYDLNGNVASRTDFNGNTTCYSYDLTRNLQTIRLEGLATGAACPTDLATYTPSVAPGSVERKTTTQWNATYRLPTVIAEPLRLVTNTYDTSGNRLTQTIQATTDATGDAGLAATVSGTPRTTTYTYNTAGQILTVDGARTDITTDITTYSYDPLGNLTVVSNALNQATTLGTYDANGRAGTLTDANGLITTLSYDTRGRLATRDTGGELTSYGYDGVGQLTSVTPPDNAAITYTYDDAHRLTDITDNLGNTIHYTLDAMGNRTQETIHDNANTLVLTHSRTFDALNRLYQDIGALNQTTTYTYDAVGNLTSLTDPLNRQTVQDYDALSRLVSSTDAANGFTSYGYDGLDQLVDVVDPNNLMTQYQRNGLGNLTQQTSPDTGITSYSHDAAGNLITRTDAKGQLATYSYDALNRLTGISYTGGTAQTVSYQHDQGNNGIGHLTQITDITGSTDYSYDQHGRLTSEIKTTQGSSYTTSYSYDAQGRMDSITYPSGRIVNYSFDGLSRISQIATTLNGTTQILASNINYQPFGGVNSFTFGDGQTAPVQTYTRQRDQDGRTASYTLNGNIVSIGYDAASQITAITNDPLNPGSYNYDALGRLTSHTQGIYNQNYSYDANGNRTSQTLGSTTSYTYAPDTNRLASIQQGNSTPQPVTQDANGATTSDPTRQYNYDIRGRLEPPP